MRNSGNCNLSHGIEIISPQSSIKTQNVNFPEAMPQRQSTVQKSQTETPINHCSSNQLRRAGPPPSSKGGLKGGLRGHEGCPSPSKLQGETRWNVAKWRRLVEGDQIDWHDSHSWRESRRFHYIEGQRPPPHSVHGLKLLAVWVCWSLTGWTFSKGETCQGLLC